MKREILALLKNNNGATFAELSKYLTGFSGDELLSINEHPSVIIWPNVSKEFVAAFEELQNNGNIELHHTNQHEYGIDGTTLKLPIATEITDYTSPHWLPVKLQLGKI